MIIALEIFEEKFVLDVFANPIITRASPACPAHPSHMFCIQEYRRGQRWVSYSQQLVLAIGNIQISFWDLLLAELSCSSSDDKYPGAKFSSHTNQKKKKGNNFRQINSLQGK